MKANSIKEIRALTGLSQARFCAKYHIPKRTLEDWERGVSSPPVYVKEILEKIVKIEHEQERE